MNQYFTGRFQGNIPILDKERDQAEVIEDGGAAVTIAKLLTCIYGGREWQSIPANDEDKNFNYIVCR